MKKFLIFISLALLAGIGYFTYEKWIKHADISSWSFIPVDAAVVFELDLLADHKALSGYSLWKNLDETAGIRKISSGIAFLDSINGTGGFEAIFKNAPTLISMHKTSNTTFDFLFVLDIQNISQNTFVGAAIGRLKESGYRFKTRNYNGFKISELSKGNQIFTCIFYKNFLLASFTPYLVEDAIRTIEGDQIPFERIYLSPQNTQPQGLFQSHINFAQLNNLLSGIAIQEVDLPFKNGDYAFSIDSGYFSVSGFTFPDGNLLPTHRREPAAFDMAEVIPENTAYAYHISSTEIADWKVRQMDYLAINQPDIKKLQDSLRTAYDFRAEQVIDLVDEEIGLVEIESGTPRDERRLCILELKNAQESLAFFNALTERIAIARNDSVYTEPYSENEIRFLPIKNFPQLLLGKVAGTYDQCFYINHRNYLIFSNNLQELKSVIASIQNEGTWGKSLRTTEFLDKTNNASNLSLFVNIPRSLKKLQTKLNGDWEEHLDVHLATYQNFEFAAFQFSLLDDSYFTNFTFSQPTQKTKTIPRTSPETGLRFASQLVTKPHLVRTHAYKDFDILVQDSTHAIYYLDPDQNTLWTKTISQEITSDVFAIDYYKNGKIQYAFSTNQQVYILDRNGDLIPGYPKQLPDAGILHFNVIDYDLSKNYRFALSDESGNTYLTDKDLTILEGWNPKSFLRKSLQPLQHQRLGRRDIMISVQQNGIVNVTNRRGSDMRGFPFDTQKTLDSRYFLRSSNGLANSSITLISTDGELIELTLEGDVIQRNQLLKTSAETTFRLVPDRNNRSFLIIRREGNKFDVLDDTGNLLFTKDYFAEEEVLIQYYEFGAGRDLLVFTDTFSETLYIYDKSGNLLTGNPLNSAHEVSILYSSVKREFQVFTTSGSNLELFTFKY